MAIASASGGILGFGKVSPEEQEVLARISQAIERARGSAPPVASNELEIKSPMIGTFYRAPSPESASYVEVGTEVNPDTVVCIMHPREFMACHYLIPDIVDAGFAAWSQSPRSVGSDLRLEHEFALYDVAAGLRFLREAGICNIVLLGNSGGSGLYGLYVQQSSAPPEARIASTPGGRATHLAKLDMPRVDGVILVAPHPGQGALLLQCIDPSVSDEDNALAVDPSLDPFDPRNGFAQPPASSFVIRHSYIRHLVGK